MHLAGQAELFRLIRPNFGRITRNSTQKARRVFQVFRPPTRPRKSDVTSYSPAVSRIVTESSPEDYLAALSDAGISADHQPR
jgi:hypothetical protein